MEIKMSKQNQENRKDANASTVEAIVGGTVNEKIAKVLGFRKYTYKVNGRDVEVWEYPEEYKNLQCGTPEYTLPDFKSMLDEMIGFVKRNHIRREYH